MDFQKEEVVQISNFLQQLILKHRSPALWLFGSCLAAELSVVQFTTGSTKLGKF
jgi:hypothetical protein